MFPNSRNVIPGKVIFTVDVRSPEQAKLDMMRGEVERAAHAVAKELGLGCSIEPVGHFDPVTFDPGLVKTVRAAAERLGYSHMDIVSGAGHDACWINRVAPTVMVMCPCVGGLSHNEAEEISPEWAAAGTDVLFHAAVETAGVISVTLTLSTIASVLCFVFATIAGFMLVAALLVMSPGPNGVLIAKTVPTSGPRAGFANILGFMTAFYFHGLMAVLGISALVMQSANLFTGLKFAGALYLIWLGLKALADALRSDDVQAAIQPHSRQRSMWAAYLEGLTTNALNPKVAMFYLAALPQFVPMTEPHSVINVLTLVFIHSLINLVWFGSLIFVFSNVARAVRSPKMVRWLKGLTGIIFLGFGARLATLER